MYIDINIYLRKKAKTDFQKDFFKLIDNLVFGKATESLIKHKDINLVTTERKINYLASERNYHRITKFLTKKIVGYSYEKISNICE